MIQRELSNTPEFKYAMSTTMAICMEAGQWHQAVHLYRALFDTKDTYVLKNMLWCMRLRSLTL